MVSTLSCQTPTQSPRSLSMPEMSPHKVKVGFSKPVHAARAKIGPPSPNHSALTAKPGSHHVHVTLWVTPPTSPVLLFLLTYVSAQCKVCHQKCTIGFKGLINCTLTYMNMHILIYTCIDILYQGYSSVRTPANKGSPST